MGKLIITSEKHKTGGYKIGRKVEDLSPYEIIGMCVETIEDVRRQMKSPEEFITTRRKRLTPTEVIESVAIVDKKEKDA